MQHLCCYDYRFLRLHTLRDDAALDARNSLDWHLDTQVTTGNHDTIAGINNLVNIIYTFLIFNLRDNLDITVVSVQDILNCLHIGCIAHKRVSDEINIQLDSKFNIPAVFLCQCRQVDMLSRHIHALVSPEHSLVLNLGNQHRTLAVYNLHIEFTIIEEQIITYLNIGCDVRIAHIHNIMRRLHFRTSKDFHYITNIVVDRFLHTCSSHLRTFSINHNTNMWRHGSYILYDGAYTLFCGMSSIHTNNVHTGEKQFSDKILITFTITDGSDNLCLFHICNLPY